jgi:hypothetical protein
MTNPKILEAFSKSFTKYYGFSPTDQQVFLPRSKYTIKGEYLYLNEVSVAPLKEVLSEIQLIDQINHSGSFFDTASYKF